MHTILLLCLVALLTITANAQTVTVTDANGNTVVEVITTDVLGNPTTSIIQTVPPAVPAPSTTAPTLVPTTQTPGLTLTSTSTSPAHLTATPPPVQQGPVGQPATAAPQPGGVTPYTYTTVINGVTSVIQDFFTPTNPATVKPTVGPPGTILNYSQWAAQYGVTSTSSTANAAYAPPRPAAGWWGVLASCVVAGMGGLGLVVL